MYQAALRHTILSRRSELQSVGIAYSWAFPSHKMAVAAQVLALSDTQILLKVRGCLGKCAIMVRSTSSVAGLCSLHDKDSQPHEPCWP